MKSQPLLPFQRPARAEYRPESEGEMFFRLAREAGLRRREQRRKQRRELIRTALRRRAA